MTDQTSPLQRIAAVGAALAGLAVMAGALGAHGLKATLDEQHLAWWQTGAGYHLAHAVAVIVAALAPVQHERARRLAAFSFILGIVVFSGSLYLMAVTDKRFLGAITPIGGAAFIVGWGALAGALWPRRPSA